MDELEFVPGKYEAYLKQKELDDHNVEAAIRECFNQIGLPEEKQNNIVLKYKLEHLSESALLDLRE